MSKEPTIDLDREDVQEALLGIYTAIQEHQGFWSPWLLDRTGNVKGFFASDDDEEQAAKALGDALSTLASLADIS